MKISDFTMQQYNVADPGQPPVMDIWKAGSKGSKIGIGVYGGKKYQVKLHEYEPKWNNASQKISAKQAELRACPKEDTDKHDRLASELETLRAGKAKSDAADATSDAYLDYKKRLIRALNNPADSSIIGPADFWNEPLPWKNNEVYSAEAVPWVDNVAVGFTPDSRIEFSRDLDQKQQFAIIASLADALAKLHARDIIHGDLKLANTLVTQEGGEFKAVLIDFDAAILKSELGRMKDVGAWYHIVGGTYFAPEVVDFYSIANAKQQDAFDAFDKSLVTEKWDIFSLGITIYEYFYGVSTGKNILPMRAPTGELLDMVVYGEAVAFGYKPDLPGDSMNEVLFGMLNWMLEKDPKDRPTAAQVRDVFKSGDVSAIPSQYLFNPLWEEHRDDYELISTAGVSIQKASRPRYRVKRRGYTATYTVDELVKEGLAKCNKGPGPALDEFWPSDGTGKLPKCVTRASAEGKYIADVKGGKKTVTLQELKRDGIVCSDAELATPWPCDSEIHFATGRRITRNLRPNAGPGYYLVGERLAAISYTKQQLLEKGLATKGVKFTLDRADESAYVPNFEGVPADVVSISRTLSVHVYLVVYASGKSERLHIDKMLERGFVKKK